MEKYSKFIPWAIIVVLAFLLWTNSCERDKTDDGIDVVVPGQSGQFQPLKPVYVDRLDTLYITKWKTIEIKTKNPVNDSLATAYQQAKDSLDRYKMFLSAIQIRNFENVFEDEFLKLTIKGQVQGELKSIQPDYKIKERTITIDSPPKTFLRGLVGLEIGNNLTLSDFRYKASVGLQNANGHIYNLGYGKESLQDYIYVGYQHSLFNWKR